MGFVHVDIGKGSGHDGGHLVTGGLPLALEGAIRITRHHAPGGKLGHRVIGPVVHGNIHERVGRECRSGKRDEREYCY